MKLALIVLLGSLVFSTRGQTNFAGNSCPPVSGDSTGELSNATNSSNLKAQRTESIRTACINGRRAICGKILRVLPDGLVIDSGYTDLMRPPLNQNWLVPAGVTAHRTPNLIEGHEPESVAVGVIFLTDLPKGRQRMKPQQYDFVVLTGYPAGQYTYTSVGGVAHTVRRFTTTLPKAVELTLTPLAEQPRSTDGRH